MEVRGGTQENMDMFGINGQAMDMGFINDRIKKGEVEIWRITGQRMPHPFHLHGASFQILTLNGEPPSEADRGWKDTVVVWDEVTEIIVRFDYEATEEFPYMYHCHMLEHEEYGMMGQFTVE
jgi:FtsP/CotA-like multicopper oxidase with cupredoxin domain